MFTSTESISLMDLPAECPSPPLNRSISSDSKGDDDDDDVPDPPVANFPEHLKPDDNITVQSSGISSNWQQAESADGR